MCTERWVLHKTPGALDRIYTADGERCVTDRVFNGYGPLIASAPELLDELKNLVVEIGTLCTEYCIPETELQAEVPSFVEAVNRADELLGRLRINE